MAGPAPGGPTARDDGPYLLWLDATPSHLMLARLFAAAVARHLGAGEEEVADLRLAVSESCSHGVESGAAQRLEIGLRRDGGAVLVRVGGIGPGFEGTLGHSVVTALVGDAVVVTDGGDGPAVEFSFRVGEG
ncbi:MAG: ATP-binding protein [Actinobacteria bacterium]|nr:ATP-binding protein [Actinomycetota bacterium]